MTDSSLKVLKEHLSGFTFKLRAMKKCSPITLDVMSEKGSIFDPTQVHLHFLKLSYFSSSHTNLHMYDVKIISQV